MRDDAPCDLRRSHGQLLLRESARDGQGVTQATRRQGSVRRRGSPRVDGPTSPGFRPGRLAWETSTTGSRPLPIATPLDSPPCLQAANQLRRMS